MKKKSVPVFMYHSVGVINKSWQWSELTIGYKIFEKQLQFFKKQGYKTIHLDDLYKYLFHNQAIPDKSVILTFDDGYADNYIFAYPLLKKYGFKGTIFVNPEFIYNEKLSRKKLYDEGFSLDEDFTGFLSWNEMLEMEMDGTMDIQSHALTHTWYPVSDEIIDFRHPNDQYIWMTWNDNLTEKSNLHLDNKNLVKLGTPVYKFEKSLIAKRYFPDKNLDCFLQKYIERNGGVNYFNNTFWKADLFEQIEEYTKKNKIQSTYETDEERLKRIRHELGTSKKILENNLNKRIQFLCWPGGSGSLEGNEIALELGYLMTTAAKDIPKEERRKLRNNGIHRKERIARTSPILIQKTINSRVVPIFCDDFGMWLRISAFKSKGLMKKIFKMAIIAYGKIRKFNGS